MTRSAVSRRSALSAEKMKAWMAADLSALDLLVIQIDGIHIAQDLILLAAVGVDGHGDKHPLGVMEGASENAAVCQALLDNMVGRGLDPAVCRLFIIDGSRALAKAIRNSFGAKCADPALSGPQGPQYHRAPAEIPARHGSQGSSPSLGAGRRRQGRNADPQSRPSARARGSGCLGQPPGGSRRDPHRHRACGCRPNRRARWPAPTSSRT